MYGSGVYGQQVYGGHQEGSEAASDITVAAPLLSSPFAVYAPAVSVLVISSIEPPLVSNAFQVFPPSIDTHGRPLAEDIRIMRVRRSE
jgi:hypothetical protein